MFEYIKGMITFLSDTTLILENQGIGYRIYSSSFTTSKLSMKKEATIYTHLHVREDDISLFGFSTREELQVFELLISVSGIGPKGALAILSALSIQELQMAILSNDFKAIAKANGVGTKTAQRVVMELKDKLSLEDMIPHLEGMDDLQAVESNDIITETALALVSLGYTNSEALSAIKKVPGYESMTTEKLLSESLKKLI